MMEYRHPNIKYVYYMTANYPSLICSIGVKLVSGSDTHYFGRTTDGMAFSPNGHRCKERIRQYNDV